MSGSGPPDASSPRRQLVEQLRFLEEMGVREIRTTPRTPRKGDQAEGERTGDPVPAHLPERTDRGATLERLRLEEVGDCQRCGLCRSRTNLVFGTGSPEARLMFIGEGPGRDEDRKGEPFVGRAGQLLTDIIRAMKYTRDEVYIANVVKCRPPENRTPEPDEIEACRGFLERQIEIIQPRVIVGLGAVAVHTLLSTSIGITKLRGQVREFLGIPVMPTYHPAYLLRNPAKKREVWEDMKAVMEILAS